MRKLVQDLITQNGKTASKKILARKKYCTVGEVSLKLPIRASSIATIGQNNVFRGIRENNTRLGWRRQECHYALKYETGRPGVGNIKLKYMEECLKNKCA